MRRVHEIAINGRFLSRPVTGVERFGREVLCALSDLLRKMPLGVELVIIAPPGTPDPGFPGIRFETLGSHSGHLWEQLDLYLRTRRSSLLNLCNSGPLLHSSSLTVIHDAAVYRQPQNFSRAYRLLHRFLGRGLALRSRVATVSKFSARELQAVLGLDAGSMPIIPNAAPRYAGAASEEDVVSRYANGKRFFLFVGSPAPHKNLQTALAAFRLLSRDDLTFVVVGSAKNGVFSQMANEIEENIVFAGRLNDADIVKLYSHAIALVFPSLYEGFGIPPLEAMLNNCPVLASNIPPLIEICGDAGIFVDPHDTVGMAHQMMELVDDESLRLALIEKGRIQVQLYSWEKSALQLHATLREVFRLC